VRASSRVEAGRWLAQAESDLAFAEIGVRESFFAQACFICQQAAEKALKALHYLGGARIVLGHSLVELLDGLREAVPELGDLREAAQQLDQYYIPTRYPNGLPGGVPADVFTRRQAEEALETAREFVATARRRVGTT
jgi:HEPN domain-containing protein